MAATVPYRVKDLIHTYGWDFIPRLAALGVQNLAEAQVLFVDSGATNASDVDDGVHGHSFENPLATFDYAVGLCTAGEQSIILLAPGHYEDYDDTTTGFDADISGIKVFGLGHGSMKPRFDFNDATSKCIIGANDVYIENVVFRPSVPTVAIGLDLETGVTGTKLKDVDFVMGEDGAGVDEFVKAIHYTSGNHDTVLENVKIYAHASCNGATHGIHVDAASNRLTFDNVIIDGPFATAGILEDAAGLNHIVTGCSIDTSGTNYSFHGSSTFAKYTANVDAGVDSEDAEALIEVARGTGNYPTGITDNSVLAYMLGKGATASASTFNNTTDSLEAIADAISGISSPTDVTDAVAEPPTAKSLQDILHKDGSYTFDNTTDALEAIRDHLDGTTILAGINVDHLLKTAVANASDMTTEITDSSILSNIMTSDGDTSGYDRSTDSLEAIADAVSAIDFTSAVSQTPTARSLQDILEKDNTGSFDDSTDSLEAIADRLINSNIDKLTGAADGGTNPYPDSVAQESVVAYLMSKSANPVTTSFNNTTDSLEAIRDNIDSGTGVLAGINVDHLAKTAVANGADLTTEVADGTILSNILTSDGDTSGYDRTTDSLEAISDLITAGTTFGAGINLDHLNKTSTGVAAGGDLTTYVADLTILSHIMTSDGDSSGYDCQTDSLEAIADSITAGTTFGAGVNLDHLCKTAVANGADLTAEVADNTILANILTKTDGDTSDYDRTTDSLEAIADAIATIDGNVDTMVADTPYIADSALPASPTANSLAAFIASGGTALGTELYDSLSIVDAIGHDGNSHQSTGIGYWQEKSVQKTSAAAAADDLFDVTGGQILIKSLIGVVTTVIGGAQTRVYVHIDSTSGNDDREFSTHVDIDADAVGTIYTFTNANPAVLTPLGTGANGGGNPQAPWYCPAGVIESGCDDAGTTGAITWILTYVPLETGVTVAASA